jgi:tetratricopeptide (TPR) repeat protein
LSLTAALLSALIMLSALLLVTAAWGGADPFAAARALEQAGDAPRALEAVEDLVRQNPVWELPRIEAARLRLKLGRELDWAEMHLEAALAIAPENPRAHFLWALLMYERGRAPEAIRSLELALVYRADYPDARFTLAGEYFSAGDFARAELEYRAVARLRPDWTHARLQLAAALEKAGKLGEAESELLQLTGEQPESALFRRKLGEFYQRWSRPELAAKLLGDPRKKMRELNRSAR